MALAVERLVARGVLNLNDPVDAAGVRAVRNAGLAAGAPPAAALMRWSSKRRRAPRHSATSFALGKTMRGLDGKSWKVVAAGKSRRWQRVKGKM